MSVTQFGSYVTQYPKELRDKVVRGIHSTAMRGVGIVANEIQNAKPFSAVNTGELLQSVGYELTPTGAFLMVTAPHAPFIEYGTRPHRPPLGPLVLWAKRRLGLDDQEAYRVARAVQKKIELDGTAPRFFMRKAMRRIRNTLLMQEIQRELETIK